MKSQRKIHYKITAVVVAVLMIATFSIGCGGDKVEDTNEPDQEVMSLDEALAAFDEAIDVDYAKKAVEHIAATGMHPELGYRTAGSAGEIEAANYIADEMEELGYKVTKDSFESDVWTFTDGSVSFEDADGKYYNALLSAEQIDFQVKDKEYDIVYGGYGTVWDLEDLDVKDKFVLVDVDQVEAYWINWPAKQCVVKGAAGIIAVSDGGYATYEDDALGIQDYVGPSDVPALNISIKDGNVMKAAIKKNKGSLKINMTCDSTIERDAEATNIICEKPGSNPDLQAVSFSAHYDGYFHAFSDDTSGCGALMGIAKAIVDSEINPERTFRFIFTSAEEWGLDDSHFDWAFGSWQAVNKNPGWSQDTLMTVSIDGGVFEGDATGYCMQVPPEFDSMILDMASKIDGNPTGKFETTAPLSTWTDAWPYTVKGIPSIGSGLDGVENEDSYYHTTYDIESTANYDPELFKYSMKLYGSLGIMLNYMQVRVPDYEAFFTAFEEEIDADAAGAGELIDAIGTAKTSAADLSSRLEGAGEMTAEEAELINLSLSKLFADVNQKLYTINWWDEVIFSYQYDQNNVYYLKEAIASLESGNGEEAIDEYLICIDNNCYVADFDKETVDYFVNQVLGEGARNAWATGYLTSSVDCREVIHSIMEKVENDKSDFGPEIKALQSELDRQLKLLDDTYTSVAGDVKDITGSMDGIGI